MAKITRIKARDDAGRKAKTTRDEKETKSTKSAAPVKTASKKTLARTHARREKTTGAKIKKPWPRVLRPLYWLLTPVRALGRYIHEAFVEVRQVRWPNRKTTWKMTFSVIVYVVLFACAIMLLDALLTLIFNNLIS